MLAEALAATANFSAPFPILSSNRYPLPLSRQISFSYPLSTPKSFSFVWLRRKGLNLYECSWLHSSCGAIYAENGGESAYLSPWDEKPYEILPDGGKAYLDEQDIVTFLDPPKELIPLDPVSYNPAAYIWKKIEDIPEERRFRLLHLLKPRLIARAWQVAGTRYEDPKLAKRSDLNLPNKDGITSLEYYNCRTSGGPMAIAWINFFKKAIFSSKDGNTYGRFIGGSFFTGIASSLSPLYFVVRQLKEVMSTEQPCDLAYELGDGLFDLQEYPQGFPKPARHPYPFNDQVVVYIRQLGPGVLVGQAWQEGKALDQVPRKLFDEILMVKNYDGFGEDR
ncbi:hypothetical protein FNV43_RR25681 [Rhamnella rubrinervis]|uniref:Uncharacterized protein n=1 Tax=Rhamnella rubrinervis TaxID=2594499 RepID=A0A8K0DLI6_9ROSA|nr:hypothetical protein FNV43_RR25681 [Rhamnella rubrinervis]